MSPGFESRAGRWVASYRRDTMRETETNFEIEVTDDVTISRGSVVAHIEHGAMRVEGIAVGQSIKTAELWAEDGPAGLKLTDNELRERWGETIGEDPFVFFDPGTARFSGEDIGAEDSDIKADLTVEGPEDDAEAVFMHTVDQLNRSIQAVRDECPPDQCDGAEFDIDWRMCFEDNEV